MTSPGGSTSLPGRRRTPLLAVLFLLAAAGFGWGIGHYGPAAALALPPVLMGLLVLARPVVGLYAVAFTIPFEGVLLIPGVGTMTKALAALVVLAWAFRKLIRRESWRNIFHSPVFVAGVAFLAYAMLSRLWATYTIGFNVQIVRLFMMFGFTVLIMDLARTWEHAWWVARLLVLGGIVGAGLTLWQSYGLGARRAGDAVAGGVNATALVLVCLLPFAFALLRSPEERGWWRLAGLVYIPGAALAVLVSLSRMSLLMGGAVILVEYVVTLRSGRGRSLVLALTGAAAVVFVAVVPVEKVTERVSTIVPYIRDTFEGGGAGSTAEASGRGYHLMMALAVFEDHPILGGGYWNFGQYSLQYQFRVPGYSELFDMPRSTHSSFFRVLADLGLVGMALWLLLLGAAARSLWLAWRRTSGVDDRNFALVRAAVLTFLLQQAYGFYAEMQVTKILWLTLGLAVTLRTLAEAAQPAVPAAGGERLPRPGPADRAERAADSSRADDLPEPEWSHVLSS